MLLTEYLEKRKRTEDLNFSAYHKLEYLSYGLYGESGELVDLTKKVLYNGHSLEQEMTKYQYEIGDDLWYAFGLISALKLDLGEIFSHMGYTVDQAKKPAMANEVFQYVTRKITKTDAFLLSVTQSIMKSSYLINEKIYTESVMKKQPIINTGILTKVFAQHLTSLFRLIGYLGTDLETILRMNIKKVEERYQDDFKIETNLAN